METFLMVMDAVATAEQLNLITFVLEEARPLSILALNDRLGILHQALRPQIFVLKTEEMGFDMELSFEMMEMHLMEMDVAVIEEQWNRITSEWEDRLLQ
jgi:hypothetical protein